MNEDEPSAGAPAAAPSRLLRDIVDQALILSRAPGSLEATSGGTVPSRRLGDFVTTGLDCLYAATGPGESIETWLASAFEIEINELPVRGPVVLARMLDAAAAASAHAFVLPPMSDLEEKMYASNALLAMEEFGVIPDDLPTGLWP